MSKSIVKTLMPVCIVLLCQGCQTTSFTTENVPTEISLPVSGITKQHNLNKTADDKLIVSWVENQDRNNIVRLAIYDDGAWQPVRTVATTQIKLAASPIVLGLSDGSLAAFWMQSVKNDKDRYAAEIFWSQSEDDGKTWTKPIHPYPDTAKIYDAQMSLTPLPDAKVALVWTDSRFVNHDEAKNNPHKTSRYQLMATLLEKDRTIGNEMLLDNDVCSCCRVYSDANDGEILTVYRDHLPGEIRDISAVRWNNRGVLQTGPVYDDHWVINGCPANGPAVSMSGDEAAVAWFSASDGQGKVRLSFVGNGGRFQSPVLVDDHAVGYANTTLLDDGSAMVSWRSKAGAEEKLLAARVTPDGQVQNKMEIASGSFPRWPSSYVAVQKAGDDAFLAWTDPIKKQVRLVGFRPF